MQAVCARVVVYWLQSAIGADRERRRFRFPLEVFVSWTRVARYWFATLYEARINARNDFRRLFRSHPFASSVFPLNYLRALRDWPTNPVRLNNLPIIRGPLCFIRRVSNKSHCVFRRAESNSIRVRTRTLGVYPARKKGEAKKRKRKRPERSRRGRSRTIRTNWLEIRPNIANLWRGRAIRAHPPFFTAREQVLLTWDLSLILNKLAVERWTFFQTETRQSSD